MSANSESLQIIFERIEAGKSLSEQELKILIASARSGQITIATGDRAVSIGGSADGAVIVTGDRNIVITGINAATVIRKLTGERSEDEKNWLKWIKQETEDFFSGALFDSELICLEKELQPNQVRPYKKTRIKGKKTFTSPLLEKVEILEIFDRGEISGRLLILGEPGSGKTTILMDLAKALVRRAEERVDHPLPVILNLSSWKDKSISEWIVEELNQGVPKEICIEWLENGFLLPMLDGLDELEPTYQAKCLKAINNFITGKDTLEAEGKKIRSPSYLVVCSRREEYEVLARSSQTKLCLLGAVYLKPLTRIQITEYLSQFPPTETLKSIENNLNLLDLCKKPFWLRICVNLSQKITIKKWNEESSVNSSKGNLEKVTTYNLLRFYVEANLTEKLDESSKKFDIAQSEKWLIYLAKQLEKERKSDFYIEDMQIDWLSEDEQQQLQGNLFACRELFFLVGVTLPSCLAIKASLGISGLAPFLLRRTVNGILMVDILKDRITNREFQIKPVEEITWSLWKMIAGVFFAFFVLKLSFFIISNSASPELKPTELGYGFNIALVIICLLIALFIALSGKPSIETRILPGQGIRKSGLNALRSGLVAGSVTGVPVYLLLNLWLDRNLCVFEGLFIGLFCAVLIGYRNGGKAYFLHFLLCRILQKNNHIPREYTSFLNYCTERSLIQRIGGRYRFIHRLLQEHFAEIPLEKE